MLPLLGPRLVKFAFSGFGGRVTENVFYRLAASCPALVSFAFDSGQKMDPNRVVCAVASCCPNLQELSAYDLTPVRASLPAPYALIVVHCSFLLHWQLVYWHLTNTECACSSRATFLRAGV